MVCAALIIPISRYPESETERAPRIASSKGVWAMCPASSRPAQSPARERSDAPRLRSTRSYSSSNSGCDSPSDCPASPKNPAPDRTLLIVTCNPKNAELEGLDDEVQAVLKTYPKSSDVRHKRNVDPEELNENLKGCPPRALLFIGHANAELRSKKVFAFCHHRYLQNNIP